MIRGRKSYARLFWFFIPSWLVPWADPCEDPHHVVQVGGANLDAGIAPLVIHLWQNDIHTHNSCQGDDRLYRLHESRHPAAWAPPAGNPYSAYLTLDSLWAAREVIRILNPPSQHLATISAMGAVSPQEWWFVHFDPSLLNSWHDSADASAKERTHAGPAIDQRSLDHPVTRLAAEYGWNLDHEYGGPGRCLFISPNGQQVAACLTFGGELAASEKALYYAFPVPSDTRWISITDRPQRDQMERLRSYFADHARGR